MSVRLTLILVLALLNGFVPETFAAEEGGESGGGCDVVIRDDTVVIADPFVQSEKGYTFVPNEKLRAEFQRIGRLLVTYGAIPSSRQGATSEAKFIDEDVLNPLIDYRLVSSLPADCHRVPVDSQKLESGDVLALGFCTKGNLTKIREDIFKKMSPQVDRNVREMALALVHERLRMSKYDMPDEYIADVTNSLRVALKIYNSQLNGDRSALSVEDLKALDLLRTRIKQTNLGSSGNQGSDLSELEEYRMVPNGGGLVHSSAKVAPDAFVDQMSRVGPDAKVGKEAQVIRSNLRGATQLGDHAQVVRSDISYEGSKIGAYARVQDSEFFVPTVVINDGDANQFASVTGSRVVTKELLVPKDARIERSRVTIRYLKLGNGISITDSNIEAKNDMALIMDEKSKLERMKLRLVDPETEGELGTLHLNSGSELVGGAGDISIGVNKAAFGSAVTATFFTIPIGLAATGLEVGIRALTLQEKKVPETPVWFELLRLSGRKVMEVEKDAKVNFGDLPICAQYESFVRLTGKASIKIPKDVAKYCEKLTAQCVRP